MMAKAAAPTASTETEDRKKEAWDALIEMISEWMQRSEDIRKTVLDNMRQGESPWQQDIFYRGAGLEDLLDDAKLVKPVFDDLCQSMVDTFKEQEQLGTETYYNG